jgi:hypothetical protein
MRLAIRSHDGDFGPGLRELVERKLRFVLGRFGTRVVGVTVHVAGPDGRERGSDKRCRIVARLAPRGRVCVDVAETDLDTALKRAAQRIGPAVSRELMRRRDGRGYPAR